MSYCPQNVQGIQHSHAHNISVHPHSIIAPGCRHPHTTFSPAKESSRWSAYMDCLLVEQECRVCWGVAAFLSCVPWQIWSCSVIMYEYCMLAEVLGCCLYDYISLTQLEPAWKYRQEGKRMAEDSHYSWLEHFLTKCVVIKMFHQSQNVLWFWFWNIWREGSWDLDGLSSHFQRDPETEIWPFLIQKWMLWHNCFMKMLERFYFHSNMEWKWISKPCRLSQNRIVILSQF